MSGVRSPEIVEFDTDTWAILYVEDGSPLVVSYATAPKSDPHNWTKATADNPILVAAGGANIRDLAVIKDSGIYHILYDLVGSFAYAYGADLAALTKHDVNDVPVFSGTGSDWEEYVRHPALLKIGATYHLFYDGRKGGATSGVGAIGHATSSDMINWTRDTANNPILEPAGSGFESSDVNMPNVIEGGGGYLMAYAGYDGSGNDRHSIGLATSPDLVTWARSANNPILVPTGATSWEDNIVSGPSFMSENGNLHIYYEGKSVAGVYAIGYATRN